MGSHLNLEHKTFPGGKLPPCVSARSAVQGIRSDHCRYQCCSTDSNNENSTELPVGLNLVTLSHPNLCPHQYVEFYRDYVFKWMHLSGVIYLSYMSNIWTVVSICGSCGSSELPGGPPSCTPGRRGCLPSSFLFFSPANLLFFPLGSRLGVRTSWGGSVGSAGPPRAGTAVWV